MESTFKAFGTKLLIYGALGSLLAVGCAGPTSHPDQPLTGGTARAPERSTQQSPDRLTPGPLAFKSEDTQIIYRIFCICQPQNGARLRSSTSGIQVSLPDEELSKSDFGNAKAKGWLEYSDAPWSENENTLFSTLFVAGADKAAGVILIPTQNWP